jgi:hypothetical protein
MKIQKHEDTWFLYVLSYRYSSPRLWDVIKAAIKYKLKVKEWYK